ncbi:MAG TPA: L-histidine N(alpha)-methyltransferase, partial [Acidimicrobiaceae bacterium]|nr:L-histidine N(alpha)-methyltransferase [Acidimicrobiaceae bacterium]
MHLKPDWWRTTLEYDVRTGLSADDRFIPAKWFYDA